MNTRCSSLSFPVWLLFLMVIGTSAQLNAATLKDIKQTLVDEFSGAYSAHAPTETGVVNFILEAAPTRLTMPDGEQLNVWAYNGQVPGPILRVKLGERVHVEFTNHLPQPTTIHWHGVRVPNAMDGVPGVTQDPIPPGGSFTYDFIPKDAGTFWFHPHVRTAEQVERGLYGILIVDDPEPLPFDQDILLVLDDWRLTPDGEIDPRFVTRGDLAHDGRWGQKITVNSSINTTIKVKVGDRLRLRLLDSANGRAFKLDWGGLPAQAIASDGMWMTGPQPAQGWELGVGNRVDVDLVFKPIHAGKSFIVSDIYSRRRTHRLFTIEVSDDVAEEQEKQAAEQHKNAKQFLLPWAKNVPVWKDGLSTPVSLEYVLNAKRGGKHGLMWMLNNRIYEEGHVDSVVAGEWSHLRFSNHSGRIHPMHIHGQFFKVLARNGQPVNEPFWRDTVLVHSKESVDVGMVPLDSGTWLLHCHILEHAAAGMITQLKVLPNSMVIARWITVIILLLFNFSVVWCWIAIGLPPRVR